MNKIAIKNFAVWAREKLIADIIYKAGMIGISENGIAEPLPQSTTDLKFFDIGTKKYAEVSGNEITQREELVKAIKNKEKSLSSYSDAFNYIVEEVAYTWFNRLIAIRFMEVNEYLPSGVRVLSSENSAKLEPDMVTTPFDTDMEFTSYEQDRIIQLKDENRLDELFRMLFIKQCNKLNDILPELFEKTDDFSELLLTISFTDKDGIIYKLVHDIDEDDFNISKEGQVEIIGWLYQYYISDKHEQVVNVLGKKTISKQDIPAATQLFTTDWVVHYMVDNSLGRYWIERNPESKLAEKLDFFVTPKDGKINHIDEKIYPTDLTLFDPCMGSGHILVYAFDVLMEIYRECGYSDRDAALNIVQDNLFGLDIDKRAYQLAYFAVMMKARSYNRRVLTKGIFNNLTCIEESNAISKFTYEGLTNDKEQNKIGEYLVEAYKHAQEIGSLQTIDKRDYKTFAEYLLNLGNKAEIDLFESEWLNTTKPLMLQLTKQAYIMSSKYSVVCTNPPYMGKLEGHLKDFVVNNYKAYSGDLFSVFMYRNFGFCKQDGYSAFMTPFVWMFIKTYEELRKYIINHKSITSLVQMEYSAFEEATVPICTFVLKNQKSTSKGIYFRLSDFKGGMEVQKRKVLDALANMNCKYIYEINQDDLLKVEGAPISYRANSSIIKTYENLKSIEKVFYVKKGMFTGKNDLFFREWFEPEFTKIQFRVDKAEEIKTNGYVPMNSGGAFRRWYGNQNRVIKFDHHHYNMITENKGHRNPQFYFKPAATWTKITSSKFSVRYTDKGYINNDASMAIYEMAEPLSVAMSLLNSNVGQFYLSLVNETLNYTTGNVASIPYNVGNHKDTIKYIAEKCIGISQKDWDSFETSWGFITHPLIRLKPDFQSGMRMYTSTGVKYHASTLEQAFINWNSECDERFNTLKANEEELNRIFIDIYGLQDELTSEVEDKDVTVRKADLQRDIKSLISYAVGCMFGRYSLDVDGLAYAGGEWDNSNYSSFIPDVDNCIPMTDEEYFEDDIVGRFVDFVRVVYGKETLEENLDFIAKALGTKGNTSREIIRNYFLNGFIRDHIKTYQKRPIYWLFDSGKQNGFKALVYMHRWNADTIGNMRVEYLHRMQRVYEKEMERMQEVIDNSQDNKEINAAIKRKEKIQKQYKETKDYDAKVGHLALSRIDIDLDDGVKVNYDKVQTANDGTKHQILVKI